MVCNSPLLPHTGLLKVFKMLQVCVCVLSFAWLFVGFMFSFRSLFVSLKFYWTPVAKFTLYLLTNYSLWINSQSLKSQILFHRTPTSFFAVLKEEIQIIQLFVSHMIIKESHVISKCVLLGPIWHSPSCGTHAGWMEFFSSLLIQGGGGVSILGCHWAEWDSMAARLEISAAGCCVCQRPVSCSLPLQTHCHPSDGLSPFLSWLTPTLPLSFATSLFAHYFLLFLSGTSQLSSMTLANQRESSGLMRLLGVAFPGEKDKQEWEREQEEARRRDHRRIGTVRRYQSRCIKWDHLKR